MIAINKQEKEAILSRFPNAFIVRTMKHKSKRHRYYCEENWRVVRFLNEYRDSGYSYVPKKHKKHRR